MAGLTEDALAQRIQALGGGAPPPQAGTMAIARRLLGPGLADRYGDVIGARPTEVRDVARDFAIGAMSGDQFKADALKAQVVQGYNAELRREEDQTLQREQAARQQLQGFFSLLEQGKKVPKELRGDFFKEGLPKIGVDATSPLFLKILTNYEKFGGVYDALLDPEIRRAAEEDPLQAAERLVNMGYDGAEALQVAQSVQQMKRYRADTQLLIARQNRQNALAAQDPNTKARNTFISRNAGRTVVDEATGEKRTLTPDEVLAWADKLYPTGAVVPPEKPGEVAPPAPAGIPQGPGATSSTTSTATTTGAPPVGIEQAPAAAAGPKLGGATIKKITKSPVTVQ